MFTEYAAWAPVSFVTVAHMWIFDFVFITQSEEICKGGNLYAQRQQQNTWVVLESSTTHTPSFITVANIDLEIVVFVLIYRSEQISK